MVDEPGEQCETLTGEGDRPESQTSKEQPDSIAETPLRDELFGILTNRRRRQVLHFLRTSETPMALADLTDELVRREADASPTAAQDERKRIYTALYHTHLPKLAEAGLVSFDADRNLVDLREGADAISLDDVRTGGEEFHEEESYNDNDENR